MSDLDTISPNVLTEAIAGGEPPAILDVRSRAEFTRGHVPGAINVPFWRLLVSAPVLPASPDQPMVVYCGHGPRARMASAALRRRGYGQLLLLDGHMAAWRRAGLPEAR